MHLIEQQYLLRSQYADFYLPVSTLLIRCLSRQRECTCLSEAMPHERYEQRFYVVRLYDSIKI